MDRKIVEQLILNKSFNEIERDLPVGKKRIKKVHDLAKAMGYLDNRPLPPFPESIFNSPSLGTSGPISIPDQVLLEHKQWIKDRLELGWKKVTILEKLPVKVSLSSFYRFMKPGIMGHSHYMMVRLVGDNKLSTTLNALESMFNEIGGVPKKLTSDNPKCFATEASKFEPILNPGFERFCSYYVG